MYSRQEETDKEIILDNGTKAKPIVTLADEYGGKAQIIVDDHCYVLCLKQKAGKYKYTPYWFKEAVAAISTLPWPDQISEHWK